jgi:hypothetical protein
LAALKPIEKAQARLKLLIRWGKAATGQVLDQAITAQLQQIANRTLKLGSESVRYSTEIMKMI